jgi:hypothetical protein
MITLEDEETFRRLRPTPLLVEVEALEKIVLADLERLGVAFLCGNPAKYPPFHPIEKGKK